VVSYINREGGTRSPTLCLHTCQMLLWCQARGIGDPHTRKNEHPGRRVVKRAEPHGVASSPSRCTDNICKDILSDDRFVRDPPQQTTASILHEGARPQCVCGGRTVNRLDRNYGVRFSPVSLLPRVVEKIASCWSPRSGRNTCGFDLWWT
jgi:hypothetical protein